MQEKTLKALGLENIVQQQIWLSIYSTSQVSNDMIEIKQMSSLLVHCSMAEPDTGIYTVMKNCRPICPYMALRVGNYADKHRACLTNRRHAVSHTLRSEPNFDFRCYQM